MKCFTVFMVPFPRLVWGGPNYTVCLDILGNATLARMIYTTDLGGKRVGDCPENWEWLT